jgi:hypothetical protein
VDLRTKEGKLAAVGMKYIPAALAPSFEPLVQAMAAMIVANDKSPARKKKVAKIEAASDPSELGAYRAWELLTTIASDSVLFVTKPEPRDLALLKSKIAEHRVTEVEITAVAELLANGGWYGEKPTISAVIRNLSDLLAKARGRIDVLSAVGLDYV